ncbi:hypothetical protein [Clostridium ihumii]|uniref:hypothetical protein n=1 Tax=Clostridium ihumii TaxID=1470356 RepID=UPI00058E1342|nr:hypothetical protein [Clostridium ihumii]
MANTIVFNDVASKLMILANGINDSGVSTPIKVTSNGIVQVNVSNSATVIVGGYFQTYTTWDFTATSSEGVAGTVNIGQLKDYSYFVYSNINETATLTIELTAEPGLPNGTYTEDLNSRKVLIDNGQGILESNLYGAYARVRYEIPSTVSSALFSIEFVGRS